MLFNSVDFLVFFPLVTLSFFLIPHKYRWALLLFASCLFYMWFIPKYILILAITIIIDYYAGIKIEGSTGEQKRYFLILSILATCAVLFVFKYFNFFNSNFRALAEFFHLKYPIETLGIILPIGLSFHTFQSLSYVIEVYRGRQRAEHNFGIYSLYVMFYPQLVAGPIERPQNLLYQFYEEHHFEYRRVANGLKLMAWGMFKKVVIADRLADIANQAFSAPANYDGPALMFATFAFAFQIYCDFSGYSDIAIGAAQVMGFRLMNNFNRPYFSKSVSEFWKRWHISLSTWFRDYLYVSLGGNKCPNWRWQLNLFITFLVSGLWHGANWTYIVWGGLNGFYLIFAIWTKDVRDSIRSIAEPIVGQQAIKYFSVASTFVLTCFAWIFFRANNLGDAIRIISTLPDGWGTIFKAIRESGFPAALFDKTLLGVDLGISRSEFVIAMILVSFLITVHLIQRHGSIRSMLENRPWHTRWAVYYALVFGMLVLGVYGKNQFIYFQF